VELSLNLYIPDLSMLPSPLGYVGLSFDCYCAIIHLSRAATKLPGFIIKRCRFLYFIPSSACWTCKPGKVQRMASLKEVEAAVSPTSSTIASEGNENYQFYKQHRDLEYTTQEAKKVLRRIDIRLIPLLFLIYMLQVGISHILFTAIQVLKPCSTWIKTVSILHLFTA
jgi:hypothetical protein